MHMILDYLSKDANQYFVMIMTMIVFVGVFILIRAVID